MMMTPRHLRLLRIDDDITPGDPVNPGPQYREQQAPDHLETVFIDSSRHRLAGINSWASAQDFWRSFNSGDRIDLVLSDVKFIDDTSPLNRLADGPERIPLPTGLSHFKAFAAIARVNGAPLGIGIHTKDASIWRDLYRQDNPTSRFMALLAAHEIGELAAILGQKQNLGEGEPEARCEACWSWLQQFTVKTLGFRDAIPTALAAYRRNLTTLKMLPADWRALLAWCQRMAKDARDGEAILSAENDCGLTFLDANGKRDLISLRSLFADTPLRVRGFEFDFTPLPTTCFAIEHHELFHELDPIGFPRIGALINACGKFNDDYVTALELLTSFPPTVDDVPPPRFTDVKKQRKASPTAVALTVLLADLRREHTLFCEWKRIYSDCAWDPMNDAFDDLHSSRPLAYYTAKVAKYLGNREVTVADVEDDVFGGKSPGALRCLQLLTAMGVAKQTQSQQFQATGRKFRPAEIPPVPHGLPAGFFSTSSLGIAFSSDGRTPNDPSRTLRILLGQDDGTGKPTATSVLSRQIRPAFDLASNGDATDFLDNFRDGQAPGWLKALCQDYADNELDWPMSEWPRWLQDHRR